MNEAIASQLLAHRDRPRVDLADQLEHHVPALEEQRVEHLVLGGEVVVDEAVGDAGLVGDVRDAAGVKALAREHAHGGVEDHAGACPPAPWRGAPEIALALTATTSSGQR